MIIVKISGGLGNQLFEYAYARRLSHVYNVPFKLDVTSYLDNDPKSENPDKVFNRQYILNRFNTIENIATNEEIRQLKKNKKRPGKIWYLYNKLFSDESIYVEEKIFNVASEIYLNPIGLKMGKTIYLDGFWQAEKYFKDCENIIRTELEFRYPPNQENASILKTIYSTEAVCMHIRRGNFLIPKYNRFHGICSLKYYQEAVREIAKRVSNPTFFIFSDDKKWVKENIHLPFPTIFVNHNGPEKDYEDLRLMSNCSHFINANSSFSWWGAWLSKNKRKVVIVPNKLVKKDRDMKDFIPAGWIQIKTDLV